MRDLAPSLLALGELFTEASRVLYPENEPVALNIKATEEGSFDVHLILEAKHAWDQIVKAFGSDTVTALANLKDLVCASGIGLFFFIKHLRGRHIVKQEEIDPGTVRVTLEDGSTYEIPADVLRLHQAVEIRRKAVEVLRPVTRQGIERVKFSTDSVVVVEKADFPSYELPEPEPEELLDREEERVVQIWSVEFTEDRKWRLNTGADTFSAAITDEDFLSRIERGEAFRKGDMLRCRIRVEQERRGTQLRTQYTVLEVIEHIHGDEQLGLDV